MQANILQPLTHVGTLNLRYEAVEELLGSEEMHVDIAQALQTLPHDLDKVCRGLVGIHTLQPQQTTYPQLMASS